MGYLLINIWVLSEIPEIASVTKVKSVSFVIHNKPLPTIPDLVCEVTFQKPLRVGIGC